MIIHSIQANNVLKYEQLNLQDLPQQGVIAISGFNESGKSTIGETICFALFGRTFSVNEDELHKIIRWGENDCRVTIQFSNHKANEADDELYAITRMLDCDGNHSAKLYKVYNEEHPIARGIERVEEALFDLTSIEYEEFVESFYLAQREITTPHPHSYALKTMAGIATMEHCENEIQNDIEHTIELTKELHSRITQIEEELNELELDSALLESLTAQYDEAQGIKNQTDETLADYQSSLEEYQKASPNLRHSLAKKSRAFFMIFVFFMLTAGSLSLWWVLLKMPDTDIYAQLSALIQNNIPQMTASYFPYLLYAGGAFACLFLFFFVAAFNHAGKIKKLRQTGINLAEKMRLVNQNADQDRSLKVNLVASNQIKDQQLSEISDLDLEFFAQQQEQQAKQMSQLTEALTIERERAKRAIELQDKIRDLKTQIDDKTARNQSRILATELLTGATRHLSKRFNHIIRDHVGMTLPLFTENRYEHLQIDNDLSVRVFSNEKHDFMDLDEISSGTQRQIMLAVRLALSQEMVSRKVQCQQFLILDEPFAFFDEQRTERSLSVLPKLSSDLPQIWIIAQDFPEQMQFEHRILCQRDIIKK